MNDKREKKYNHQEDGVSETVGFMIMFALVMTGIGLITLYGYPMLMKEQANANVRNMERNMIVLQNDLKSLTFKSVPYQETDFQVSGGVLSVESVPISGTFSITGIVIPELPISPNSLQYRSDSGGIVSMENGAVLLRYENQAGSTMIALPRWFYDDATKTFVLPLINIQSNQQQSQNGVGRVRMQLSSPPTQNSYDITGNTVTIQYTPNGNNDFSKAWGNYFESLGREYSTLYTANSITIPSGATKLVVKQFDVTILGL